MAKNRACRCLVLRCVCGDGNGSGIKVQESRRQHFWARVFRSLHLQQDYSRPLPMVELSGEIPKPVTCDQLAATMKNQSVAVPGIRKN